MPNLSQHRPCPNECKVLLLTPCQKQSDSSPQYVHEIYSSVRKLTRPDALAFRRGRIFSTQSSSPATAHTTITTSRRTYCLSCERAGCAASAYPFRRFGNTKSKGKAGYTSARDRAGNSLDGYTNSTGLGCSVRSCVNPTHNPCVPGSWPDA
jgi:hypothetical protein